MDPGGTNKQDYLGSWADEEDPNTGEYPSTTDILQDMDCNNNHTQKRTAPSDDEIIPIHNTSVKTKKSRTSINHSSESTNFSTNKTIESFQKGNTIIIAPANDSDTNFCNSPIAISRGLTKEPFNKVTPKDVRINKRRNIVAIELENKDIIHMQSLLDAKTLDKFEIKSYIPRADTICSGVIGPIDKDQNVDEIKGYLRCYTTSIIEVTRLYKFRNTSSGRKEPAQTLKIDFEGKVLPTKVYIGSISFSVTPYNLPPLRCFKCQKLGHMANGCTRAQICNICSGNHRMQDCDSRADPRCANCHGAHVASSPICIYNKKALERETLRRKHDSPPVEQDIEIQRATPTARSEQNTITVPIEVHQSQGEYYDIPSTTRSYSEVVKEAVESGRRETLDIIKHHIEETINKMTLKLTSFLQEVFSLQLHKESYKSRQLLLLNLAKHHFGRSINFSSLEQNLCFTLPQSIIDTEQDDVIEPSPVLRTRKSTTQIPQKQDAKLHTRGKATKHITSKK